MTQRPHWTWVFAPLTSYLNFRMLPPHLQGAAASVQGAFLVAVSMAAHRSEILAIRAAEDVLDEYVEVMDGDGDEGDDDGDDEDDEFEDYDERDRSGGRRGTRV